MPANRILHVDGDSFFASCEIALNPELAGKPIWVGGGRNGDGIVIAANRLAKNFGITTSMACHEAKQRCPTGILCRPHYEEYRDISQHMFHILEQYSPVLVPISIDEGFLDLTGMENTVWRNSSAAAYVEQLLNQIRTEVKIPVSAGLASSSRLAKLATDAGKPGFLEIPEGTEKAFLSDRPLRELSGVGEKLEEAFKRMGASTFGDLAKMPAMQVHKKFGIWGQEVWLLANGLWREPLVLEQKQRTTISSSSTLPEDETDYQAVLIFLLSESARLIGQLRRKELMPKEVGLIIRYHDFTEKGGTFKLNQPQFRTAVIGHILEDMFKRTIKSSHKAIRQVRITMQNLHAFQPQDTLWGQGMETKISALDKATDQVNSKIGRNVIKTGAQFALEQMAKPMSNQKAKCPFVPQREMVEKLGLLA